MKKLSISFIVLLLMLVGCNNKPSTADDTNIERIKTDVVVIGAGGAGLTAAIEAHDAGTSVIIIEKMPVAGGNTVRATAGMNAADTKFQEEAGIEDSADVFYTDTMKGGYETNDPELVKYLTDNSADAIDWLDSMGIPLSNISATGGQSINRTHRPADGSAVGGFVINGLMNQVRERDIPIYYLTTATKILTDDSGKVIGVEATAIDADGNEKTIIFEAIAVVVTTGGFGNNFTMITEYVPELDGFVTTNHSGATGDGIKMVQDAGGALVDMKEIQIHPTVEQSTSDMITEATRGDGGILISQEGTRFTNEMLTRDVVSADIIALPEQSAYVVFNKTITDGSVAIARYTEKEYTVSGETIEELAENLGIDPAVLAETLDTWNAAVASGTDAEFGRATGMTNDLSVGPYYAIKIAPGVHHTMGGVKINTNTEVLAEDGNVVIGLYAAGEVTGGVHGGNRLGGNAVADIIVFGRQAGKSAAEFAKANGAEGPVASGNTDVEPTGPIIKDGLDAQYNDGTYTATVTGHEGDIEVVVTVEGGYITKIETPVNTETVALFEAVESTLIPAIIYNQTTEGVDVITSATVSSEAIIEALNTVIEEASK